MTGQKDHDLPTSYASPPCFIHEIDPAYTGLSGVAPPSHRADVLRWRKAERERLIRERLALGSGVRRDHCKKISLSLERALGDVRGLIISVYWESRAPSAGDDNLNESEQFRFASDRHLW